MTDIKTESEDNGKAVMVKLSSDLVLIQKVILKEKVYAKEALK